MMSIKNNILVIFSSIFLMLSNSAISQDIFLNINQNRTYNTDVQKNVNEITNLEDDFSKKKC